MGQADDSSLDPHELRAVQLAARRALDRASGWGVYPTPIADVLTAANIKVATASIFDPRRIMEYLIGKAESTKVAIRSAISKMFGVADTLDLFGRLSDVMRGLGQLGFEFVRRASRRLRDRADVVGAERFAL